MKTRLMPTIILLMLLLTWGSPAEAANQHEDEAEAEFTLALVDLTWLPEELNPGDRVAVIVEYQNAGPDPVPAGAIFRVDLVLDDDGRCDSDDDAPPPLVAADAFTFTAAELVAGGRAKTAPISLAVPGEGSYRLTAVLAPSENATEANSSCRDEAISVVSALPPSVAQLLAGLGTFAAVMAIMALGTEVTIDSLKFFIGLKQKVTAMEAFDKLEAELPGRLAALGVTAERRAAVNETLGQVRQTLEPVESAQQIYTLVQQGDFSKAYEALVALAPAVGHATDEHLENLKANARLGIQQGFVELCRRLDVPAELKADVETYVLSLIDNVTVESATTLLDDIFKAIRDRAPKLTVAWLESQVDNALGDGRAEIERLIDTDVLPALTGLGFAEGTTKRTLTLWLDEAESVAGAELDEYLASLKKLLLGVEERRNEMQSPLRKIYRRLRESDLAALAVLAGLVAGYTALLVTGNVLSGDETKTFGDLILQLILTAITAGIVGAVANIYIRQNDPRPPPAPLPLPDELTQEAWERKWVQEHRHGWLRSLGYVLRTVEYAYNKLLGRDEQPRERYGLVDEEIIELIDSISATSAAEILLRREDHHRDEEASRLRVLRVIAIIVGFFLAYFIQIDAALLLDEAVPGIANTINGILFVPAATLQRIFPWFALPPNNNITAGIILTGLAASAGSAFWHDFLGRLQGTKEATEATAKLLRRARDLPGQDN